MSAIRERRCRTRRALHPAAWWAWAAGMAVAAIQTTNPLLLALLGAVLAFVVSSRRTAAPWSNSLAVFFRLGLVVIAIRVLLQIVFGERLPGHELFSLPEVPLPRWAAGVSIGGPVTVEAVLQAACQGLRLAVILLAFGAANSLASPYRLLRCLPTILYEAGVAVTVALAFAPELVMTIRNLRQARRLRGRANRGPAGLRGLAVPVLEGALDRSLQLAASMDARGYGRRSPVTGRGRRLLTAATAAGLLLVAAGAYGSLDPGAPAAPGAGALFAGVTLLLVALAWRSGKSPRTRYRPDPWRLPEWGVTASGAAVVLCFALAAAAGTEGLQYSAFPLSAPLVPPLPCLGAALGLLPAVLAPQPPEEVVRTAGPAGSPETSGTDETATEPAATAPAATEPAATEPAATSATVNDPAATERASGLRGATP